MLFAAEDGSWVKSAIDTAKYIIDSFGWPGAIVILAIIGIIWYVRTYGEDHKKEIVARTAVLVGMAEHAPKQLQCNNDTVRVLEKLSEKSSDVVRTLTRLEAGQDDLAKAVVAGACPERVEVVNAHLKDHLDRVNKRKEERKQ